MLTQPMLFLCKGKKDFIIIDFGEDEFGMSVAVGCLIPIAEDYLEKSGLNLTLSHLNAYTLRDKTKPSEFNRMTLPQKRKFFKQNKVLSIRLSVDNMLRVVPVPSMTGESRSGRTVQPLKLELPATNVQFLAIISEAFAFFDTE